MASHGGRPPLLERPGPRLLTGAIGGFIGGVVFIALNAWFASSMGRPEMSPFRLIATIAQGGPPPTTSLWVGMAVHAAVSVVLGMILAAFTVLMKGNGTLMAAGFVYGGIVYAVNFHVFARFVDQFTAFQTTNQPFELAAHLVFGGVTALFLLHPPSRVAPREFAPREEVPRVPSSST